jgi:starch phosphorylase
MKATIQELSPVFNTARMVQDYTQMYYYPALEHARRLSAGDYQLGREFAAWLTGLRSNWEKLVIRDVQTSFGSELIAGDMLQVTAEVFLGEVKPDHVAVQLFEGVLNVNGEIEEGRAHEMHPLEQGGKGKGWMRYSGEYAATSTGRHGCTVRIVPRHHLMGPMVRFGLVTWAS